MPAPGKESSTDQTVARGAEQPHTLPGESLVGTMGESTVSDMLPPSQSSMNDSRWARLRAATTARIQLGQAGGSLTTRAWLEFGLDHARARDSVWSPWDPAAWLQSLGPSGLDGLVLHSRATERQQYLMRPDLGRQLDPESARRLDELRRRDEHRNREETTWDLVIIVSDGLAALAADRQAGPLLEELIPALNHRGWRIAPVIAVRLARVAIADEIGERLNARLALILLGERPGLGSPDSLGAYFVYGPRSGKTDADRNCVSNIRPAGLPPTLAAETLAYLLGAALERGVSGVLLKDDRPTATTTSLPPA